MIAIIFKRLLPKWAIKLKHEHAIMSVLEQRTSHDLENDV